MPSTSVGYTNGRISVRRRGQLTQAVLERLRAASSLDEALRVLQETGWTAGDLAGQDYEQAASGHLREASRFVRDNAPSPEAIDCFLLPYDINNLKLLIKARTLGIQAGALSDSGTIPVDTLRHAVAEGLYGALPQALREPLEAMEKRLAVRVDAMDIDVTLDQAMYALIFEKLRGVDSRAIHQYFSDQVDLKNALSLLRFSAMGKDFADYERVFLPGGGIPLSALKDAYVQGELLPRLYARFGREIAGAITLAQEQGRLAALEKAVDDHLLALMRPYKFQPDRLEAVVGYLLAEQREVMAVRLILAAKENGFSGEAVEERLRELHG